MLGFPRQDLVQSRQCRAPPQVSTRRRLHGRLHLVGVSVRVRVRVRVRVGVRVRGRVGVRVRVRVRVRVTSR